MSLINTAAEIVDDAQINTDVFLPATLMHKFAGKPKTSILKSSIINSTHPKIAVALSNNLVKVYDHNGNSCDEYAHDSSVTFLKFSTAEPDLLYTSSLKGKIHIWDTRCQRCVQTFYDDSDGSLKPILCFDYDHNEQIISAGTELIREDAFHLFWDRRSSKILGGYWDSHAGDITQIAFHPRNTSWMASSSVDGLINIFDLSETSEDDALMQTINVEAPINTFTWKSKNTLACTTSIEEFYLMKMESERFVLSTSREKLLKDFQISVDCMIDSLPITGSFFLATGKNTGLVHLWNIHKNQFHSGESSVGYFLKAHTDVVRTISYSDDTGVLVTGGDDGCVCLWKLEPLEIPQSVGKLSIFSNGHAGNQ